MSLLDALQTRIDSLLQAELPHTPPDPKAIAALRSDMKFAWRQAEERADPSNPNRAALPAPDWEALALASATLFETAAPSMDCAVWLLEAWTQAHGFTGLAAGARLAAGLIERDWNRLEPRPEGTAPAPRETAQSVLRPLQNTARAERLPPLLRETPLFETAAQGPYKYSYYLRSRERGRLEALLERERKAQYNSPRVAALEAQLKAPDMLAWDAVVKAAQDFHGEALGEQAAETCTALRAALAQWSRIGDALQSHNATGIVALEPVRTVLEAILSLMTPLAASATDPSLAAAQAAALPAGLEAGMAAGVPPALADAPAARAPASPMPPRDREQALAQLALVAAYFRQAEPQAPIGPALEEVIRRARLSWADLMAEMIPAAPERGQALLRLGIQERADKTP